MPYPRAIIFDLDGTLADSVHDIAASMNVFLNELGQSGFETSDYLKWIGGGSGAMVARIAKIRGLAFGGGSDGLKAQYLTHYSQNLTRTRLFVGVSALLQTCVALGVPISLLSNKDDWMVQVLLNNIFPDTPFVEVIGLSDAFPKKPDPSSACYIAERMGVRPAECLFVGDTETDMRTAIAANMQSAAALWGYGTRRALEQTQPNYLLNEPAELEVLIKRWHRMMSVPKSNKFNCLSAK
ncbi:MAG: HAD family hydrolase [Pseudoruegeria sp.]